MATGETPSIPALRSSITDLLEELLGRVEAHPRSFLGRPSRTRISLALPSGERIDLDIEGEIAHRTCFKGEIDPSHDGSPDVLTLSATKGINDLGLSPSAKAAAQSLLDQFPDDVSFTSGLRTVFQQARATAANVVQNRKYISQTYKDTPQREQLQKWVDDHPKVTSAESIAAGLEGVMNGWTEVQKRSFSRHITGDAFDVQPVGGETGDKIKAAISNLPKLNWHTFTEGGLERWHAQFEA